jgi:hypothetical protein
MIFQKVRQSGKGREVKSMDALYNTLCRKADCKVTRRAYGLPVDNDMELYCIKCPLEELQRCPLIEVEGGE